jgi:hypothetical protein
MITDAPGQPHVPYAQFQAMLRAGNLAFIRRNAERITMGLVDAAVVCRLIAEQDPGSLEPASVQWIRRFAAEAAEQERRDYGLIVRAFDMMTAQPELAAAQLAALCAARGLDR